MPLKVIKQVISQFRKNSSCPFCKSKFPEDNILVLATGGQYCFFFVLCPHCHAQSFLTIELHPIEERSTSKERIFQMKTKLTPQESISMNEILDMKNFLKQWRGGDLRDIFKI